MVMVIENKDILCWYVRPTFLRGSIYNFEIGVTIQSFELQFRVSSYNFEFRVTISSFDLQQQKKSNFRVTFIDIVIRVSSWPYFGFIKNQVELIMLKSILLFIFQRKQKCILNTGPNHHCINWIWVILYWFGSKIIKNKKS